MSEGIAVFEGLRERGLSGEQCGRLARFHRDLLRFNRSLNLVSRRASSEEVAGLVLESALAGWVLPATDGEELLDLGSGAGLPGLAVAVVRPGLLVTLLERRSSRCVFLRRERAALGLGEVGLLEGDAVELGRDPAHRGRFHHVLLKAVAAPPQALELARPFLRPGGRAWIFRDAGFGLGPDCPPGFEEEDSLPLPMESPVAGGEPALRPFRSLTGP